MHPATDAGGRRDALLIGTGTYADPAVSDLKAPVQDVRDLAEVLGSAEIGRFRTSTMADRPGHDLRIAIEDFLSDRRTTDLVLIYLSGHGELDARGKLHFVATDTVRGRLASTAIGAEWLLELLDKCSARRRVLILDCCYSGAFAGTKAVGLGMERLFGDTGSGLVVLTASRPGEWSREHPSADRGIFRSVFTEALVEGLRTGDADLDRDGFVSARDAYRYCADRLHARGAEQNPQQWMFFGEGEILLSVSPRGLADPATVVPASLRTLLESPHADVRLVGVGKLAPLLDSPEPRQALAVRQLLQVATTDVPEVAAAARRLLGAGRAAPEKPSRRTPGRRMSMSRSMSPARRRTAIGAALTLLLGGAAWVGDPDERAPTKPSSEVAVTLPAAVLPACTDPDPQILRVFTSPEKAGLLDSLAADYGSRRADGTCVRVRVTAQSSGRLLDQMINSELTGDHKPDVLTPASSRWFAGSYYRAQRTGRTGQLPPLPQRWESTLTSPAVIAMPRPMAEELRKRHREIGWRELAALARDPKGWGAEWGPFRLGKTNPLHSTSGLIATLASTYAFTSHAGDGKALTLDDINDEATRRRIQDFEKSVVHYGENTLKFLSELRRVTDEAPTEAEGLRYISAVAVEESSIIAYNLGYPCGAVRDQQIEPECAKKAPPKVPLVAVYPSDGTLVSDHPYLKMAGLSTAKTQAADDFLAYVRSEQAWPKVSASGFRSFTGRTPEPTLPTDVKALPEPSPEVLDHVLREWPSLRKPANVLLAIDTSKSMRYAADTSGKKDATKIGMVKGAKDALIAGFSDHDRVGLWSFASTSRELVPPAAMTSGHRAALTGAIDDLKADGRTRLYDTCDEAVQRIRRDWDPEAINAIIVLSDGRNDITPTTSLTELLGDIAPGRQPVRVYTIAYGRGADPADGDGGTVLQRIADVTGGARYSAANPKTIRNVFIDVVSNF